VVLTNREHLRSLAGLDKTFGRLLYLPLRGRMMDALVREGLVFTSPTD